MTYRAWCKTCGQYCGKASSPHADFTKSAHIKNNPDHVIQIREVAY